MSKRFDLIVIGAGQSGPPLAGAFAKAGKRVAVIERDHVGGTCVNRGCTPTKTMIAAGRVAYLTRRAADFGIEVNEPRIDMTRIRERKRDIVDTFRSGSEQGLEQQDGVELVRGEASFVGPKQIKVNMQGDETRELTADLVLIDTGMRPRIPDIPGLDATPYLTSTTIMELAEVPEHLVVLGGGYVGLEFGQLFRRLGGRVTILQRRDQLLPREDADIADAVADILSEDGIDVRLGANATAVRQADRSVTVDFDQDNRSTSVEGSHLLVATGRVPNTDALKLEAAGVETDAKGFVRVNEHLETSADHVLASGDVTGGPPFTHTSYDDFRVIKSRLLGDEPRRRSDRTLAYTVFIDPQLGRVGLSESQAREQGYDIDLATLPMTSVARALEIDEARGMMKAVVDRNTKRILGAAVLGPEGGEVVATIQTAMMGDLPFTALRDAPFAHPTLCESLNNLFSAIGGD